MWSGGSSAARRAEMRARVSGLMSGSISIVGLLVMFWHWLDGYSHGKESCESCIRGIVEVFGAGARRRKSGIIDCFPIWLRHPAASMN